MTWINLREEIADLFATAEESVTVPNRFEDQFTVKHPGTSRRRWDASPDPRRCEHERCGKVFTPKVDRGRFCCPEHRRLALAMKKRRETTEGGWFRSNNRRRAA